MKKNKKFGWIIIIEGFSGSGKSSIAEKIFHYINKNFGKTALLDGDDLRLFMKSVNFKMGFRKKDRGSKSAYPVSKVINLFLKNNINVVYANVGLNKSATKVWYKNFKNLIYIHIASDIKKIIKFGKKDLYKKNKKNIVGLDIKPDINKKADIIIVNDFNSSIASLAKNAINKLKKIVK